LTRCEQNDVAPDVASLPPEHIDKLVGTLQSGRPDLTREAALAELRHILEGEGREALNASLKHPIAIGSDYKLFTQAFIFSPPLALVLREPPVIRDVLLELVFWNTPHVDKVEHKFESDSIALDALRSAIRKHWQGNFTHRDEQWDREDGTMTTFDLSVSLGRPRRLHSLKPSAASSK
jgi:hypothetical protein